MDITMQHVLARIAELESTLDALINSVEEININLGALVEDYNDHDVDIFCRNVIPLPVSPMPIAIQDTAGPVKARFARPRQH